MIGKLDYSQHSEAAVSAASTDAKFVEQPSQGIGVHSPYLHQLGTHAMQSQADLLLFALDWYFPDIGLSRRS